MFSKLRQIRGCWWGFCPSGAYQCLKYEAASLDIRKRETDNRTEMSNSAAHVHVSHFWETMAQQNQNLKPWPVDLCNYLIEEQMQLALCVFLGAGAKMSCRELFASRNTVFVLMEQDSVNLLKSCLSQICARRCSTLQSGCFRSFLSICLLKHNLHLIKLRETRPHPKQLRWWL